MTKRKLEKLLQQQTGRPRITLELYLRETEAQNSTAAECAAELNRLLGISISAKNLHNLVKWLREKHGFEFTFRDSRGRRISAEETAQRELQETIRQLTSAQRLELLASAKQLRTVTA